MSSLGSGGAGGAVAPSQQQLDAETAALVAAGHGGWMVCWSKRLARRYWYKKPTRSSKEITQWEPPQARSADAPLPAAAAGPQESKETDDSAPAQKRRKLDQNGATAGTPTPAAKPPPEAAAAPQESSDDAEGAPAQRKRKLDEDGAAAAIAVPAAPPSSSTAGAVGGVGRVIAPAVTAFSNQSRFDAVMALAHRVIAVNVLGATDPAALTPYLDTSISPPLPLPAAPPAPVYVEDNPRTITLRRDLWNNLISALTSLCAAAGLTSPPPNLFQRFGFSQRALQGGVGGGGVELDPLLPAAAEVDEALVQELVREGVKLDRALWVAQQLAAKVRAAAAVAVAERQRWKDVPYLPGAIRVVREQSSSTVKVQFVEAAVMRYFIPLNASHWDKLQRLYSTHTGSPFSADGSSELSDVFLHRVFAMLARYDTIAGAGYQAAMPEPAFDLLRERLGTNTECFASPLNCYLPRYHSAFPDTDRHFGSLGSFYTLRASGGSYESNPPFVELDLACNALHLLLLLHRAQAGGEAMQVVVVWPGWDDTPGYVLLTGSPLMRRLVVLGKGDHVYKEGFQHRARRAYRESTAVSFIFFFQTDAAAAQYPVDDHLIAQLRQRFQQTAAAAAMVSHTEL